MPLTRRMNIYYVKNTGRADKFVIESTVLDFMDTVEKWFRIWALKSNRTVA